MDAEEIADRTLGQLEELASPEQAAKDAAEVDAGMRHLGVPLPLARKTAKQLLKEHPEVRLAPWPMVRACWDTGCYDLRRTMAFYLERATLGDEAAPHLEHLLRHSGTWTLVDQLAMHVLPRADVPHPTLKAWVDDGDVWLCRGALLADMKALRSGDGNPGRWAALADGVLGRDDHAIASAIGSVLRETRRHRHDWVERFIQENKDRMSRLSLDEANRTDV